MGRPAPIHTIHYTYTDYLALESSSNVKHEFLAGQIYAMAGGTPEHAALAAALIGLEGVTWQQATVREGEKVDLRVGAQLDVRELYEAAAEPTR